MVLLDELEDEERPCEVCGAQGCLFELQLWQWLGEGESVTDEVWWFCPQHTKAVIKNIADYLGYLRIEKRKEEEREKLR